MTVFNACKSLCWTPLKKEKQKKKRQKRKSPAGGVYTKCKQAFLPCCDLS